MGPHISEERLFAFVDKVIGEAEAGLIRDHLAVCDRCWASVEEMRSLFSDLGDLAPAPEEPDLMENTLQLLQIARRQPGSFQNRFPLGDLRYAYRLIATGAVAAGLALGILIGSIAYMGLMPANTDNRYSSIVLQEGDQTIKDRYVAMIINNEQDY